MLLTVPTAGNGGFKVKSQALRATPEQVADKYNHDLDVSREFTAAYPTLAPLLRDERLLMLFRHWDNSARLHKRVFHILGLASLCLGTASLLGAALRLSMGEDRFSRIHGIGIAIDACAVLSLILVALLRARRDRARWCQALFMRERLRMWHFQLFLDGSFVSLLSSDPSAFELELTRRWGVLQQHMRDGFGWLTEFRAGRNRKGDIFHEITPYSDKELERQVLEVLWILRIEHQLRFSSRKIEENPEDIGLTLTENTKLSDTVASASFAGAVLVTVAGLIGSEIIGSFSPGSRLGSESFGRVLAGCALALAVLSAAARAYRAGFTIPEETSSYEEYSTRVRDLAIAIKNSRVDHERFIHLTHFEESAADELRRFLDMKLRATFLS